MLLDEQKSKILLNAKVGIEFEFYSNFNTDETAVQISRLLNKRIHVETTSHSDFTPTADVFKLEPDFSGGMKLLELITGPIAYQDARLILIRMNNWINENGSTKERCALQLNISFDKSFGNEFMSKINVLKYVLEFNEDLIYKYFPNRKGSAYAKSIKYVLPKEKFYFKDPLNINPRDFIFPREIRAGKATMAKYYGINFDKLTKNYLELRYLGGDDYQKKTSDILKILDYFILITHKVASDSNFTQENRTELQKIYTKHQKVVDAYKSPKEFVESFPDIGLLVDLDTDERRLNTFWPKIRDRVYELLTEAIMRDGMINYDSNTGRIQIKDANLKSCYMLTGFDVIGCTIIGNIYQCDLFNCELTDCIIEESNVFNNSNLKQCRVFNSYINRNNKLYDCWVAGTLTVMNGEMTNGIFREGKVGKFASFKGTEVIDKEKVNMTTDWRGGAYV
tara:strand:- start:21143 stop:22495 length:1353 start_codon:yes stop_codon:yes gene_type:complete